MNEMHEKGGAGIKTSRVASRELRIGGGNARKRPRRVPRDGTVRVSPTTIGGPNWKNRRSVDQKAPRTDIGATIGRPNWKNGHPVDQKTPRTGIGATIGRPNWKNGHPVDQTTPRTGVGATIGQPNWKNRRSVDQKTPRTGIGATIGRPNWKNRRSVDQKTPRTDIGATIGGPNWKSRRGVDQNVAPRACRSATGWEPAPSFSRRGGAKRTWRPRWRARFRFDGGEKRAGLAPTRAPPMGTRKAVARVLAPTKPRLWGREAAFRGVWRPRFPRLWAPESWKPANWRPRSPWGHAPPACGIGFGVRGRTRASVTPAGGRGSRRSRPEGGGLPLSQAPVLGEEGRLVGHEEHVVADVRGQVVQLQLDRAGRQSRRLQVGRAGPSPGPQGRRQGLVGGDQAVEPPPSVATRRPSARTRTSCVTSSPREPDPRRRWRSQR